MSKTFRFAAVIALLLAAASYSRADDVADIRASGKAFARALTSGDAATAKKHAITDETTAKLLDVMVQVSVANKKLTDAAVAKFGDEGKTVFSPPGTSPREIEKRMEDAKIHVNGDTAIVEPMEGQQAIKFKKVEGDWKVDFTDLPHEERLQQGIPMMAKMATAMNETAGEINDGKYKTAVEARQALFQKVAAAGGFGTHHPTGPTSAPDNEK